MSITGMAYASRWNSTDQIPVELTQTNQMSRWGTMNPRDGGSTSRFSLSGRWAEETTPQGRRLDALTLDERIDLLTAAADAVAAAHAVGVLHQDLKPANMLIVARGAGWQLRLTDFGSARLLNGEALRALQITQLGLTVASLETSSSTPWYAAPELLRRERPTARCDVFALGVVLYQLVAGDFKRPLVPGWERDVPDELLREDIAAATDQDAERRLPSAAELAERLHHRAQRLHAREQQRAETERRLAVEQRLARADARRPWAIAAAVALLLGTATSAGLYLRERAAADTLARQVAAATERLRDLHLYKPPGVAETIDWAQALSALGVQQLDERTVAATLGTVLKYREDQERVREHGLGPLLAGIALIGAFIRWESQQAEPMVPLGFFRSRGFSTSIIVATLVGFGMFGSLFVVTLYMQNIRGYDAIGAGLRTLPLTMAVMFIGSASSKLHRFTTNWPVRRMLPPVSLKSPGPRPPMPNAMTGGLPDIALKNENGARLTTPDAFTVEIQPIGRGATSALNGLCGSPCGPGSV